MKKNNYTHGDWNVVCQRYQKQLKASQIKKEWTGLLVGPECFELRHPQDFVKGKPDPQRVPYSNEPSGDPTSNSQTPFDPDTDSIWQSVPQ